MKRARDARGKMKALGSVLLLALIGCTASSLPRQSMALIVTEGAYVTDAQFPDGRSALPAKRRVGDLEPLRALNRLELAPGPYTLIGACLIKDGAGMPLDVSVSAGETYVLRCDDYRLQLDPGGSSL